MKILLAPSESKNSNNDGEFSIDNFRFKELIVFQKEIVKLYEEYILSLDENALSIWFGIKNIDEIKKYHKTLEKTSCMKAIQRYSGVAFDALNYNHLQKNEQKYIDENVLIFSNLFGVISASDDIPNYKFKQGSKLPSIELEKYYNQNISNYLDQVVEGETIDLRAGFYEKFYKSKKVETLSFKFIKDGKVVSHWAKYYRGKLLQCLAKNQIKSIAQFMHLEFEDLRLVEIKQLKNVKLLVLDIL